MAPFKICHHVQMHQSYSCPWLHLTNYNFYVKIIQNFWLKHRVIILYIKIVLFTSTIAYNFVIIQKAGINKSHVLLDDIKCNPFVFIFWMHLVSPECTLPDQSSSRSQFAFFLHKLTCT